MAAAFDLDRFVRAQALVMDQVRAELAVGHKTSHWMWFVFPQLAGLGRSQTAQFYALSSLDEARAYLAHALLGHRLVECTDLVNRVVGRSAHEIFNYPDDLKFHSSMTLFSVAAGDGSVFHLALDRYFEGADDRTLRLLGMAERLP